jgi:hypothetical protein
MFEIHKTNNGSQMLICQMDDEHLFNTIKLFAHNLKQARVLLENPQITNGIMKAIIGNTQADAVYQAEKAIKFSDEKLRPYIVAACYRGLDVKDILVGAYGEIPITQPLMLKSAIFNTEDDEEFDF